ncbi:MAG: acyl-CoA carboxylase subunit epsilon [Geodermatophilaceae bacterium]|nr:acyl-CoA carboxylase subunit epsilon [Geodermatophilaceae bacterium]
MRQQSGNDGKAVLRVLRGEPTDEELAALLVVVLTRTEPAPGRGPSGWRDRRSRLRAPLRAGPGVWRRSPGR